MIQKFNLFEKKKSMIEKIKTILKNIEPDYEDKTNNF